MSACNHTRQRLRAPVRFPRSALEIASRSPPDRIEIASRSHRDCIEIASWCPPCALGSLLLGALVLGMQVLTTTPRPLPHRYALGSLLLGALVFGFMLSSIGGLVKGLDKENIRLQQKMDEVKEFTRWHKMPSDLSSRVRK